MSWIFLEHEDGVLPAAIRDAEFLAALPAGWVLTRSAAALGRSATDGRWVSYPANTARLQVDPLTLEKFGVLIEPEATQLVFNSRSPNYVPSNATNAVDATALTPFGPGALKLTPNTTNATHGWNFFFEAGRAATVPDNAVVALRIVLRPVGAYTRGRFALLGRDGVYRTVSFSLVDSGTITATSGTLSSTEIKADTDGFYSIKIVMNFGTGTSPHACNLAFALDDDNRTFIGDGVSHFLVAYLGAEIGDTVTSPILTTGAQVTRPADSLVSEINWAQSKGMSIGIDYTPISRSPFTAFQVGSAIANNGAVELVNGPDSVLYRVTSLGTLSTSLEGAMAAPGVRRTAVVTAAPDHFRLAVDGNQLGVDGSGAIPIGMTTLSIGNAGASGLSRGAMVVRRFKVWDVGLDGDAVKAFSKDLSVVGTVADKPVLELQQTRVVAPQETSITLVLSLDRVSASTAVSYRTVDDTAKAGIDYVGVSGQIFFGIGESTAQVTILMAERALSEDRTFRFELFNPVNCTLSNYICIITLQRVVPAGTVATTKFDFDTDVLSADWTLTRASAANTRNAAGLWISAAANAPRLHYHAPGVSGLLLEPLASEQRLYDSVDPGLFSAAGTKFTIAGQQTATGTKYLQWRKDATTAEHKLTGVLAVPNCDMPTGEFTLWFLARPVNWPRWKLRVKGIDNIWRETRVTLSGPGSVTASETGTTAYAASDPHFVDWYQFGLHRPQAVTAGVSAEFELIPVSELGDASTIGDVTQGIDICHIQLEPIAGMTSPILATAAVVKTVRAADVFRATTGATWYKQSAYTIAINFIRLRGQPITQRLLMIKDQSIPVAPDDIGLVTVPASLRARIKVQNTTLPEIVSSELTVPGVADTAMLTVSGSKIALFHNGEKSGQDVLTVAPVVPTALRIGSSEPSGNDPMSVVLRQVYSWNTEIPETDALLFSGNLSFVPSATVAKPIVSVPTTDLYVKEGEIINVPVSKFGTGACSVNIRTKQNTAIVTTDYTGIGPVAVNFLASETQKLVPIQTVANSDVTPIEDFSVVLELIVGNTTCVLGNASCKVSIYETPRVDISTAVNTTEGQLAVLTVTKSGYGACSVTYRTVGDTATTTDGDYTGIGATTLSFTDTEITKTVSVSILQDNKADSGQKFKVVLENATNCTLGNATCTITIYDVGVEPPAVGQLYTPPIGFAQFDNDGNAVDFGIGQTPYYVTSLEDPATLTEGTLRHAVSANNRLILFEVGGCIRLRNSTSDFEFNNGLLVATDNITIAGETAPSPGIIIQNGTVGFSRADKTCIRHITIERGYDERQETFDPNETDPTKKKAFNSNGDAIIIAGTGITRNVWFDHVTTFWSNDEGIQIWKDRPDLTTNVVENISITNTMICEPLYKPEELTNPVTGKNYQGHWEGGIPEREHNYGTIVGDTIKKIDYQHVMITDAYWRGPIIGGGTTIVLANMLELNCVMGAHHGGAVQWGATKITCAGYLKIAGVNCKNFKEIPGIKLHGGDIRDASNKPLTPPGYNYHADTRVWYSNLYADRGSTTYPLPATVIWGRTDSATLTSEVLKWGTPETKIVLKETDDRPIDIPGNPVEALSKADLYDRMMKNCGARPKDRDANGKHAQPHIQRQFDKLKVKDGKWVNHQSDFGGFSDFGTGTKRSLRDGKGKFKDGSLIPAFPSPTTDKVKVRAWLRRFLDDVQYD